MLRKFVLIGTENLIPVDFVAGGLSFFPISFGGVFMGIIFAILVSLLTKCVLPFRGLFETRTKPNVSLLHFRYAGHVWIAPPVFIFTVPYLAYLVAELFGLSAILA